MGRRSVNASNPQVVQGSILFGPRVRPGPENLNSSRCILHVAELTTTAQMLSIEPELNDGRTGCGKWPEEGPCYGEIQGHRLEPF